MHEIIAVAGGLDITDKTVNHINGNKSDNRLENLEVLTLAENTVHQWRTGLAYRKIPVTEHERIEQMMIVGYTQTQVAEIYGVRQQTISCILKKRRMQKGA